MSSAFVICRRSPVLAWRSALVRPHKLHAARSASAARFRRCPCSMSRPARGH